MPHQSELSFSTHYCVVRSIVVYIVDKMSTNATEHISEVINSNDGKDR